MHGQISTIALWTRQYIHCWRLLPLAIGDSVSSYNDFHIIYRCLISGTPTQWGIAHRTVPSTYSANVTHNPNAVSYWPVLTTPQLEQYGLGFTGYTYHMNEWPGSQVYFNTNTQTINTWKNLPAADNAGYVELGIVARYLFIKINNNLDALLDEAPRTVQSLPFPLVALAIRDNESSTLSPTAQVMAHMPTLTIAQRVCTPYNNTVKLPPVYADSLMAVGDSGPPTDFWIEMRCPTYLGAIGYYVVPAHGLENEAQGVIKINPASQAQGIGLQITTRTAFDPNYLQAVPNPTTADYQPLKFGPASRYAMYHGAFISPDGDPLTAERDLKGHNPSIPLRVAVWRTGTVVPGTYNAAIFIHLVYK